MRTLTRDNPYMKLEMRWSRLPALGACLPALALLGACGGPPPLRGSAAVTVTDLNSLPAPSAADQIGGGRPYLVGPLDKLSVDVYGVEAISREVQVDASGRIALPLAGTIEVLGTTPPRIATLIADRLRTYVRDPQVTVSIRESVSQTVTIDGEVEKPGVYPVIGDMTLMRAIATAEGESTLADSRHVAVFRSVGGRRMAAVYDLRAIRRGAYADPNIYANDTVVVGQSATQRMLQYAIPLGPALVTPLIYLIR